MTLTQRVPQTFWYNETVPYQGGVSFHIEFGGIVHVPSTLNVSVVTERFTLQGGTNYTARAGDFDFIRTSEDPCVLGVNCTLLAPFELTINYSFREFWTFIELNNDIDIRIIHWSSDESRTLVRLFLYPNSTGSCTLGVDDYSDTQPPNETATISPNELFELELEPRLGRRFLVLQLSEWDTEIYGILTIIADSIPPETINFLEIVYYTAGYLMLGFGILLAVFASFVGLVLIGKDLKNAKKNS
ncbi:MAG: hypothetical protein ACFFBD_04535 [Candidatus Hodarchaeota archaeon]